MSVICSCEMSSLIQRPKDATGIPVCQSLLLLGQGHMRTHMRLHLKQAHRECVAAARSGVHDLQKRSREAASPWWFSSSLLLLPLLSEDLILSLDFHRPGQWAAVLFLVIDGVFVLWPKWCTLPDVTGGRRSTVF